MKTPFCLLTFLIASFLFAQDSSISRIALNSEQGKMRTFARESLNIYSSLEKEITPKYQVEKNSFSIEKIRKQYENALQQICTIEGPIHVQDSVLGKSRIWEPRHRLIDCDPLQNIEAFSVGPEEDVIPYNGELTQAMTDMSYPLRGNIGFSFRRHYSSQTDYNGPLGNGWDFTYNAHLLFDKDSLDESTHASLFLNGKEYCFTRSGSEWHSQPGNFLRLENNSDLFFVYDSQLKRMEFEPSLETKNGWRLKAIASRHSQYSVNRVSVSYQDNSDRISHIVEPYGNRINVCYDHAGRIVQIASPIKSVLYLYNSLGLLDTVSYSDSAINFNEVTYYKVQYGYSQVLGRNMLVSRRINDSSSIYSINYDSNGKVSEIGYKSDDKNAMWSFQRNDNVVTVMPAQPATAINYVFNSPSWHDLPSEIITPQLNSTEKLVYNSDGLVVEHWDSAGVKTVFEYDSNNRLPELHANLLRETLYPSTLIDPNASGKIVTEKQYLIGTAFLEKSITYENNEANVLSCQELKYSKDNYDLVSTTDNGILTRFIHNKYGETAAVLDANNNATIYYYATSWPTENSFDFEDGDIAGAGLLVSVVSDSPKSTLDDACIKLGVPKYQYSDLVRIRPVSFKSQYAYDKQGRIIHSKEGKKISFSVYNRKGDVLATWNSQEGTNLFFLSRQFLAYEIYHQFTPGTSQSFKGCSNRLFSGNYYIETIGRDSLEQIESVSKTNELFNGMAAVYTYSRYPNGVLRAIKDPVGITRVDEYGNNGLLRRQYLQNGDDWVSLNNSFEYYPNGTIKSYIDSYGEEVSNGLDSYGRLAETTDSLGIKTNTIYDGIGRVVEEHSEKGNITLSKKEYAYDTNGLLSAVYEQRISNDINEKILIKKIAYDNNGNIIASRGVHDKSWEHFLYDGMNRVVVHKLPSGDYTTTVYDDDKVGMTQQLDCDDNNNYRSQCMLFVLDKIGNPVVSIPTDIDHQPQYNKSVYSKFDERGFLISTKRLDLNDVVKEYDSLGRVVLEKVIPLSSICGEKEIVSRYSYMSNGNIVEKRVENNALALFGHHDNAKAALVYAPQITSYTYDKLGREHSIRQPDGLIVEKYYNGNSMPVTMIWKHANDENSVLRQLKLSFGKQGRLASIADAKTGNVLRKYQYDDYGNRIIEIDGDVTVSRQFDSMGLLLSEQTVVKDKKLPGFTMKYSLQSGTETLIWNSIARSRGNWSSQTVVRDPANRVEAIRLDQSSVDFARWKYLGSQESERRIPESHITQRNEFNKYNELSKSTFLENSSIFGELSYLYDSFGNEIYSSTSLAKSSYTYAQYMAYNSFQQIVAQNSEINLPQVALDRRRDVLGTKSLQSIKTSRMVYDQVDNIWAKYQGQSISSPKPDSFSSKELSAFLSSAKVLFSNTPTNEELIELSSNRETTLATFSSGSNLTAEENEYDKLGNLIKFKGEFWNHVRTLSVVWNLSFDPMGRLVYMQAFAESDTHVIKKGQRVAELFFKYDADNRRIYKEVKDYSRTKETPIISSEWTIYSGNSQALVLRDDKNNSIIGQYLWKPDSRELLMVALPQNLAENLGSMATQRYYFQQDRAFNTVCVTKAESGKATLVSAASYMCFGENTTTARVKNIDSSMSCSNASVAFNNSLDDSIYPAAWTGQNNRPHFLTINLTEKSDLSSLNIWTDSSFPKEFYVFVLPPNIDSPKVSDDLNDYCSKMEQEDYLAVSYSSNESATASRPITIPLWNLSGNKIVLAWNANENNTIHINELEIERIPNNPGAIAFAGQWLDRETNLYYQINRYKIAGSNKFISPDPIGFLDGNNLYAYARNNPLSWHDPNGEWVHILLGAVVGAAFNSGVYAIKCWITGEEFSWKELAIRAGTGALAGGVAAATFGAVNPFLAEAGMNALTVAVVSNAAAGAAGGFAYGATDSALHGGDIQDVLYSGIKSAAIGGVTGGVIGGVGYYASQWSTSLAGGAGKAATDGVKTGIKDSIKTQTTKIGDFTYKTDSLGRVLKASGKLSLERGSRSAVNQRIAAQMGNAGDQGGHLIPARYGGPGNLINHVPQSPHVNQSSIKIIENAMGRALKEGKDVYYSVEPHWSNASTLRPSAFTIRSIIDGVKLKPEYILND